MFKYIQKKYRFNNYQIAQLKFFLLTLISEFSKTIIIGAFFINQYCLFIWCLLIFQLMRTSTGGIHCKKYISCLGVSFFFFLLCIRLLPNIHITKTVQLILLFVCIYISYNIGPVVSSLHLELSHKSIYNSKNKLAITILCYSILVYIMPQYCFISVGFWVIILNTIQLVISKLRKEVNIHEK